MTGFRQPRWSVSVPFPSPLSPTVPHLLLKTGWVFLSKKPHTCPIPWEAPKGGDARAGCTALLFGRAPSVLPPTGKLLPAKGFFTSHMAAINSVLGPCNGHRVRRGKQTALSQA